MSLEYFKNFEVFIIKKYCSLYQSLKLLFITIFYCYSLIFAKGRIREEQFT